MGFPSKELLQNEWNWGGYFLNSDELRFYVPGAISPDDFKEITGEDYEKQNTGQTPQQ